MKKKILVISLGGSLIVPEKMDIPFLLSFIKILRAHYHRYKFVLVCGGGVIARKYISVLKSEGKSKLELAEAGIRATRMNAQFVMQMFGKEANDTLPLKMKQVKDMLPKNSVVICGALRFEPNATSDSTAAALARYLKSDFINLTNVLGLYTSDPRKNKNAKFIPRISWAEFEKKAKKIKYKPGQNFILDQKAAGIIKNNRIPTILLGSDLKNFSAFLQDKEFLGTIIRE